jgi:cobalt-zinc-cadmium efflux system outer membrane protein
VNSFSQKVVMSVSALVMFAGVFAGGAFAQAPPAERPLRLEDLERMALEKNPTAAQAAAAIRAAQGRRLQAGFYPNPVVGYLGEDITAREPRESKHFLFIEQTIVTGGKLGLARDVASGVERQARAEQDAQRQRIVNAVRMLFYEALGAERLVQVRRDLSGIGGEAVGTTEQLFNIGQADRPDLLEAEVEAQRMQLDLIRAENERERVWRVLAAVVGDPALPRAPLVGDLEAEVPSVREDELLEQLLRDSPEVKAARASVDRARAAVEGARAVKIPNVRLRGGVGYNFERAGAGRDVGTEFFVEVGIPLPLFNQNQGGIASAEAELARAEAEIRRLELELRSRFAGVVRTYRDAVQLAERYQRDVLPRAQRAYQLYLGSFQRMAASYPQVLIAQRTLGQVRADYVRALVDAWQNAVVIQGFLLTGALGGVGGGGEAGSEMSGGDRD